MKSAIMLALVLLVSVSSLKLHPANHAQTPEIQTYLADLTQQQG